MIRAVIYRRSDGEILRIWQGSAWQLAKQIKAGEAGVESDADEALDYFPGGVRTAKPVLDAALVPLAIEAGGSAMLTLGEAATLVQEDNGIRTDLQAGDHELSFPVAGSYPIRLEAPLRRPAGFTVLVT